MKNIILLMMCFFAGNVIFSQKMMTRNSEIKFEASMPAFEEIAATNNTVSSILDSATGEFVALALVKAFKFKVPLMEEHFNENYIESSRYPKATFKGKFLNFDALKVSSTKKAYDLEGDLTLHGITKKIKTKMIIVSNAGKVNILGNFKVNPKDYGIKIPNLVKSKIAEEVKISINFTLQEN